MDGWLCAASLEDRTTASCGLAALVCSAVRDCDEAQRRAGGNLGVLKAEVTEPRRNTPAKTLVIEGGSPPHQTMGAVRGAHLSQPGNRPQTLA